MRTKAGVRAEQGEAEEDESSKKGKKSSGRSIPGNSSVSRASDVKLLNLKY